MLEYRRKENTLEFILDGEPLLSLNGKQQLAILYDKVSDETSPILQCHGQFWPVYERFQKAVSVLQNAGQNEMVKSLAMWHISVEDIDDVLLEKINNGINGAKLFDGEEWKKHSYTTHSNQIQTIMAEN